MLLNKGARPDFSDDNGQTPLTIAKRFESGVLIILNNFCMFSFLCNLHAFLSFISGYAQIV